MPRIIIDSIFVHILQCTICETWRDIDSPVFGAPVRNGAIGISPRLLASEKSPWASTYGVVSMILHAAVLVQYRLVTDRHTTTAHTALA